MPVVALGVGIGVDYSLYLLTVYLAFLRRGLSVTDAYCQALVATGKVVALIGVTLAAAVVTWVLSPIKFQADMGILLAFMFLWNMLGAPSSCIRWRISSCSRRRAIRTRQPIPVSLHATSRVPRRWRDIPMLRTHQPQLSTLEQWRDQNCRLSSRREPARRIAGLLQTRDVRPHTDRYSE